jgi:urease accessory protein
MAAPVILTRLSMSHRFAAKSVALGALFAMGLSTAALAHPGHGGGLTAGFAHPFTGLDHLLAMIAVGLWASQLARPAMWTLPVVFPAMMALGAALGTSGVIMPWIEMGILVSVVVLGAAVALQVQAPLALGAVLVATFAVLHGYVHGAELPAGSSAWLYGIGFVAATLALHAIGIGAGLLAQRPLLTRTVGGAIGAIGVLLLVVR